MLFPEMSCNQFVEALGSKAPVPGGGGASALVGAVATALGNMVGSLTVGKKKYADVEPLMYEMMAKCDSLQRELLALMERDADVFAPLAKAYGMPRETPEEQEKRAKVMAVALANACEVPMKIMEKCCAALELISVFAEKGSALAISDAGAAAVLCKGALQAASLNVLINTKEMEDRELAEKLNAQANAMLEKYLPVADEAYRCVLQKIG